MRPQKVEDQPLLNGLMSILRARGYDGSSLNELASSSGLQKASLYYRFPGGKKDITLAVLHYVNEWTKKYVYELLTDKSLSRPERLRIVIGNINRLYNNGKDSCVLKALSMDSGIELFGEQIKGSMDLWMNGFTAFGIDCGLTTKIAKEKSCQVLVIIQGSLIVSKGIDSTAPFTSAMKSIEKIYTGA